MNHIERRTCSSCRRTKPASAFAQHGPICRVCVALPPPNTRKTVEGSLRRAYDRMHLRDRVNAGTAHKAR